MLCADCGRLRLISGDWTNGWPQGFFTDVLSYGAQCAVGDSVENCPATAKHLKLPNPKCDYKGLVVDEVNSYYNVADGQDWGRDGVVYSLPGNNPVWGSTGAKEPDANYVENGVFVRAGDGSSKISRTGPDKAYAQINAGDYLWVAHV